MFKESLQILPAPCRVRVNLSKTNHQTSALKTESRNPRSVANPKIDLRPPEEEIRGFKVFFFKGLPGVEGALLWETDHEPVSRASNFKAIRQLWRGSLP